MAELPRKQRIYDIKHLKQEIEKIEEQDMTKASKSAMPTRHFQIQIHFKLLLENTRESIKFGCNRDQKISMIASYSDCDKFDCEGREIHPSNVSRISVC
ncbi:MAG TPA: hypothetical protein VH415_02580 [Nitrososphaeraceae archaeon]|jgi:hypothetical protein